MLVSSSLAGHIMLYVHPSQKLELTDCPAVCLFMSHQSWDYELVQPCPLLYSMVEDQNLGPHICMESIYIPNPSPQLLVLHSSF